MSAVFASLVACAETNPGGVSDEARTLDGDVSGSTPDGAHVDATPLDGRVVPDVSVDQPATTEVPPVHTPSDPCAVDALLTVERDGEVEGLSTRFFFDTATARPRTWLQPPPGCAGETTNPVVVRYVLRRTARLHVTTVSPLPHFAVDTVAWLLDRCASEATVLGCNDTTPYPRSSDEGESQFETQEVFPVGAEVYVVVAGVHDFGEVALTISEAPAQLRAGARCEEGAVEAGCEAGTTCVAPLLGPFEERVRRCTPVGSLNGACRTRGSACDDGLACAGPPWNDLARCRPPLPSGTRCTLLPYRTPLDPNCTGACVEEEGGARCRLVGERGGPCRADGECDGGLQCATFENGRTRRCVTPLASGAVCTRDDPRFGCPAGEACVRPLTDMKSMRCLPVGAREGRCRPGGGCDVGLRCVPWGAVTHCAPTVGLGEWCDAYSGTNGCEAGASCTVGGQNRCVREGSYEGACRREGPMCDQGLACLGLWPDRRSYCGRVLAVGRPCSPNIGLTCTPGSACLPDGDAFSCVPDGAGGGRCRFARRQCDDGFSCNGQGLCAPFVPFGQPCEVGWTNVVQCEAGTTCHWTSTGHACEQDQSCPRVCLPLGSLNGRCRWSTPPCDQGLSCSLSAPFSEGVCGPRRIP